MSILGIVPSAGEGTRWGGYFKELLPIGYDTLLDRSISAMFAGGADKIVIVSKPDKLGFIKIGLIIDDMKLIA